MALQLANLHGDLVATCADATTATGTSTYNESTEYGTPRSASAAPDTYGWLGAKQRSTNALAGLTLMGVRLYNPTTGRFLTTDPVPGGTDNPYVYVLNPTDQYDLNGMWGWRKAWNWTVKHRSSIAGFAATGAAGFPAQSPALSRRRPLGRYGRNNADIGTIEAISQMAYFPRRATATDRR